MANNNSKEQAFLSLYNKGVRENPRLTEEELDELLFKAKTGDKEAREKITCSFFPMIRTESSNTIKKYYYKQLELSDVFNEGVLSFAKGLNTYLQSETKMVFPLYIKKYVHTGISKYCIEAGDVKIPADKQKQIWCVVNFRDDFINELSREPSYMEIADACHMAIKQVKECFVFYNEYIKNPVSLNEELDNGEGGVMERYEAVPDKRREEPSYDARMELQQRYRSMIEKLKDCLTPVEKEIIRMKLESEEESNQLFLSKIATLSEETGMSIRDLQDLFEDAKMKMRNYASEIGIKKEDGEYVYKR